MQKYTSNPPFHFIRKNMEGWVKKGQVDRVAETLARHAMIEPTDRQKESQQSLFTLPALERHRETLLPMILGQIDDREAVEAKLREAGWTIPTPPPAEVVEIDDTVADGFGALGDVDDDGEVNTRQQRMGDHRMKREMDQFIGSLLWNPFERRHRKEARRHLRVVSTSPKWLERLRGKLVLMVLICRPEEKGLMEPVRERARGLGLTGI